MKRSICRFLAAVSALCAAAPSSTPTRPRYGGTLRVEMRAVIPSLDPADLPADPAVAEAKSRLLPLLFDRLVERDETGRPLPSLAVSWQHDPDAKQWQFRLRSGVKFHDGSPLTVEAAADALNSAANGWTARASSDAVLIESDQPLTGLLLDLAQARHSVFLRGADGTSTGTGPFRLAQWQAGRHAAVEANEEYWAGRPFLDAIDVTLGRSHQEQWVDLELGRADVIELRPNDTLKASQSGIRIWSSAPIELLALVFSQGRPRVEEGRVREAIALAIDRSAIHGVLLQKQGEPSGGLLPEWLSGYSFLFPAAPDLDKARSLASALAPPARSLSLGYDGTDPLARAVAERVAVNAREAGITLQVSGQPARVQPGGADLRLVRLVLRSLQPERALAELAGELGLAQVLRLSPAPTLEDLYAAERALIEDHRVIPIAHLPEIYAVGSRVKSWSTPGLMNSGAWHFEDLWLKAE